MPVRSTTKLLCTTKIVVTSCHYARFLQYIIFIKVRRTHFTETKIILWTSQENKTTQTILLVSDAVRLILRYSSKVTSHSLAIVSLVSRIPSTRSSTLVKDHSLYIESESLKSASCFINRQLTQKLLLAR